MNIEDHFYKALFSYKKMPDMIKRIVTAPFKVFPRTFYLGPKYKEYHSLAMQFEYASINDIEEFQFGILRDLLKNSYDSVPFYRKSWNALGIQLKRIQSLADFKKTIPCISREDVQKNPMAFVSEKYDPQKRLDVNTSGSIGSPLALYYLKGVSRPAEIAHMHVQWQRSGYLRGGKIARLRGDFIGGKRISTFDPWRNILILSSFNLNKANALDYLKQMRNHRIEYIQAYPSSLFNLIQLAGVSRYPISSLKTILLGSENILDWQIEEIGKIFETNNIFYWYGHGELCALGGNCEKSHAYHFMPTYGYVELHEDEPGSLKNESATREIIGTSFINPLMPLIRYRTADYGVLNMPLCACGRNHYLLKEISGREQEIATGDNGERITLTALIHARHAQYFHNIRKMQLVNTAPGRLIARIVPKEEFGDDDRKEIVRTLSHEDGLPFSASVEIVDDIAPTSRGKHRLLVRTF